MMKFLLTDTAQLVKKEKALYAVWMLFIFSLYTPGITWFYNLCMWLLFVHSFFFNSIKAKWRLLKQRKDMMLMIAFFLLNCISALLSENTKEGISWVGIRISMIAFPLSVGAILISGELKEKLILGFATVTTCAAAGCLLWGIFRVINRHDWQYLYNDNLSDIINLQSIYFAMLINIAIISFVYLLLTKPGLLKLSILLPAFALLLVVQFLLASRIALSILSCSAIFFALYQAFRKKKLIQGIAIVLLLSGTGILLLRFFPKTANRFRELGYTTFSYNNPNKESHFNAPLTADQWNGATIRLAVWHCAATVTKDHWLLGTGLGDKMDVLKNEYAKKGFAFGIQTNRNVHNNHLDVIMSLGLIGLIVYGLAFFALPLWYAAKNRDYYGIIVIACFAVSLFTETYMDRTFGNTILSFFICFLACYRKQRLVVKKTYY